MGSVRLRFSGPLCLYYKRVHIHIQSNPTHGSRARSATNTAWPAGKQKVWLVGQLAHWLAWWLAGWLASRAGIQLSIQFYIHNCGRSAFSSNILSRWSVAMRCPCFVNMLTKNAKLLCDFAFDLSKNKWVHPSV